MASIVLSYPEESMAIIICQNIHLEAVRNVAKLIEQEALCDYCKPKGHAIHMIGPDFALILTFDLNSFLTAAFGEEGYEIEIQK